MNTNEYAKGSFVLGRVLATPGALDAIQASNQTPGDFLVRHLQHDWGCIAAADRRMNDQALVDGSRILSAYETRLGVRLWVITDAADAVGERASTTILLPQEY